jgi:uncharacterized protein
MPKWWETEPIQFECQPDCFKCCTKPGVVNFDRGDIYDAAKFLEIKTSDFKRKFLKKDFGVYEMELEEGQVCRFLTLQGCAIHPAKPKQCHAYPFWKENLRTRNHWQLTAGFCPGIGKGPIVPTEEIKQRLKDFRS